jgi:heme A synthase
MKKIIVLTMLLVLAIMLSACMVTSGEIVDKVYTPAHTEEVWETEYQTINDIQFPVSHVKKVHHPATWEI